MTDRPETYTVTCNAANHSPADLLAAVRAAVESGTIEGEVVVTESANVSGVELRILQVTEPGTYLVIPAERGEGGNK